MFCQHVHAFAWKNVIWSKRAEIIIKCVDAIVRRHKIQLIIVNKHWRLQFSITKSRCTLWMPLVRFSSTQRIKTNMNSRCRGGTTWNHLLAHFNAKIHHWSIDSKNYQASNWPQYIKCSLEANKIAIFFTVRSYVFKADVQALVDETFRVFRWKHGLMNFSWKFQWEYFRIKWENTHFLLMLWKVVLRFWILFKNK